MSTESGSTAAGEPRRRAEDTAPAPEGSNEPDVTRRLDTEAAAKARRRDASPTQRIDTPEGPQHSNTQGSTANPTQRINTPVAPSTHRRDTDVTGTRDPNDAAYRTEQPETRRLPSRSTGESASGGRRRHEAPAGYDAPAGLDAVPNREALLAAERERFGGMKFGAAFFGWLTATGMVVLLSAAAAAIGTAVGVSTDTDLGAALDQAAANQSAGLIGAIITLAVLLLAYYAGGYVAGRMARFNGLKQGLAVWLWALVAAAVVLILGLIYGNDIRSITALNPVAPFPEDLGSISAGTWLAVLASLAVSLVGAILGGLAGMRFHRRVDRAHFTPVPEVH